MSDSVDFSTFTDCDFTYSQTVPVLIGTNRLHMQVRQSPSDPTVWIELSNDVNGGIVVTGTSPETLTLTFKQSLLEKMPPGSYVYSIVMSSQGGTIRTGIFRGNINHQEGPTKWAAGTV